MFKAMSKSILSNSGASIPGEMAKQMKKLGSEQSTASRIFQGDMTHHADRADSMLQSFSNGNTMDGLKHAGKIKWDAMTGKDMAGEGWARTGAVAARNGIPLAAYGALAGGTRLMTGGSITTNNQGQRDIAGIPFL